jgi:hypothetical protein
VFPLISLSIYGLITLFTAIGLATNARPAAGGLWNWLIQTFKAAAFFGAVFQQKVVQLAQEIANRLGIHAAALEGKGTSWIAALNHYSYVTGYWSLLWPVRLTQFFYHLVTHTIPRQVNSRTAPIARTAAAAEAQAKAATGVAHSTARVLPHKADVVPVTRIERVAMPHAGEWDWIHKHYKTLQGIVLGVATAGIAGTLPHAPTIPLKWPLNFKWTHKRLHRLELLLGVAGFAGILASVMGVTANCLKPTGPIGKTARRLCGLPTRALEDLLAVLVDLYALEHICDLITLMNEALGLVQPEIEGFISGAETMFVHCGYNLPAKVDVPVVYPPFTGINVAATLG